MVRQRLESRNRGGFTLVELLVVIAIIGILIALLLPAVQAAREAARRSQCTNNVKQLVLACHNYHDIYKSFPTALNADGASGAALSSIPPYHYTWVFMILPFMEQKPLYDQTDTQFPAINTTGNVIAKNGTPAGVAQPVVGTQIDNLICPSSNRFPSPPSIAASTPRGLAYTTYPGSMGYHWQPRDNWNVLWSSSFAGYPELGNFNAGGYADYGGVFALGEWNTIATVRDGTSNTMMIGEHSAYGFKWGGPHDRSPTYGGNGRPGIARLESWGEAVFCSAFTGKPVHGLYAEANWGQYSNPDGGNAAAGWWRAGPHAMPPVCVTHYMPNSEWPGMDTLHAGPVMITGVADGSVRALNINVRYSLWLMYNGRLDGARFEIGALDK